ncbi:hypothetical protein KA478_02830 [Patescibacteria group bacterium]|nr:hypothetical protein [Patescibacteria group bacterium]
MNKLKGDTFTKTAPVGVSYTVYSTQEYDYTIEGLKQVFGLSDEQVRQATGQWISTDSCRVKIVLNTNKKQTQ